jgi:RNA polymerase sigma factor (sigma-70 family)
LRTDQLLPRIATGDSAAVRECIARYGGLVWSLARRFLGNSTDAEDAVQDVFVDLWRNAAKYDPSKSAEPTFITMVARRRLIDRKRRTARVPVASPLEADPPGRSGDGESAAELSDEAARAAEALRGLKDEQRRVIGMAIYQGLTHEEIATATGLPLGTVKTHIRRGLLRIRELLGGGEP